MITHTSTNPLENSTHGYYTVGQDVFLNKVEAVYRATQTHQDVTWHFHDSVYSKIDWTIRPAGTLNEMYRDRAQQLRDEYDYIVVHFSGGMDSWTVLHSFLANGIHVDEVYTRWPKAERKYKTANTQILDESNIASEFEYAVLPVLEQIQKDYPTVNIVIDDYSECFEQELTEGALLESAANQSMGTFFRFNRKSDAELVAERAGKRIAVVYGYDRVRYQVNNGKFYAHFTDFIGGIDSDPARKVELFYWTDRAPMIPVLQAHCIKQLLDELGEVRFRQLTFREVALQTSYSESNFNPDTFQVGKILGTLVWKSDSWICQYNPRYYKSWRWVTDQYFNSIDNRFLDKKTIVVGLERNYSQLYFIGDTSAVTEFNSFG